MSKRERGVLICFEGLDGVGKTTQVKLLAAHLESHKVPHVVVRFPADNAMSGRIATYLDGAEEVDPAVVADLYAKNRELERPRILQHLLEGKVVILDRYTLSGLVYSMARGTAVHDALALEARPLVPDITFLLQIDAEEAVAAIVKRKKAVQVTETATMQRSVALHYEAQLVPHTEPKRCERIPRQDAELTAMSVLISLGGAWTTCSSIAIREDWTGDFRDREM